jgi:hypothetical protein
VEWEPDEPLGRIAEALAPGALRVSYPGVWLREDVYAIHGHYGDRHTTVPMFERLGAGAMARIVHEPPAGPRSAEDYERVLEPIYAWLAAVAEGRDRAEPDLAQSSGGPSARVWGMLSGGGGGWQRWALGVAFPAIVLALNAAGLGPLRPAVSGPELRRAALGAFGQSLERLGVAAEHVLFGHTHRAGPLPDDEPAGWRAPTGASLLNTGCWIHEPAFLGPRPRQSPYRAGFGAIVEHDRPPRLVNLLDGFDQLR